MINFLKSHPIPLFLLLIIGSGPTKKTSFIMSARAHSCEFRFEQNDATFDLTEFEKQKSYRLEDFLDTPDETDDYEYEFKVCHNLEVLPACNAPGKCEKINGEIGAAYQILTNTNNSAGDCKSLGTAQSMQWSLLDESDGTVGVRISYTDGEVCPGYGSRKFHILIQCENTKSTTTQIGVKEARTCEYEGVCGVDMGTNQTHCFCNEGYNGLYCQSRAETGTSASSAASPSAVLAAISLVLLVILLALGIYLYISIQRLKNEHSYGNFEQMIFEADGDGKEDDD
eukprot:jgi/Bigna1/142882/aug1.73_g17590